MQNYFCSTLASKAANSKTRGISYQSLWQLGHLFAGHQSWFYGTSTSWQWWLLLLSNKKKRLINNNT